MATTHRLVVLDARMLKAYGVNDPLLVPDELEAFQVVFSHRQLRLLLTPALRSEYQREAERPPQFQLQPILNTLNESEVIIHLDDNTLRRFPNQLTEFPQWHQVFVKEAIAARATYFITKRRTWLSLSEQTQANYRLSIATPEHFVFLEG